jgi:hypothetical protein
MANKTDLVFKRVINKEYTGVEKQWYEEQTGTPFILKSTDVWISDIPSTPPTIDSAVIKIYKDLSLTKNITINDNKAWIVTDNLKGFITPRYGLEYSIKLFDGLKNQVYVTHPSNWFFDYENGILTFDLDPSTWFDVNSFSIDAYLYIGKTVADLVTATGGSAWQDPVLAYINDPPSILDRKPNDRYLININPTGIWSGYGNSIVEWDGVNWNYISAKKGEIVYSIAEDRLYVFDNDTGTWSWSGIDSVDLDYDNSNSGLSATNVKSAIDEVTNVVRWDDGLNMLIIIPTPNVN